MGRLNPCPDGVLRPGFVTPYYPYLFPRPHLAGIFVDYFHTLTKQLGCERLEFRQFAADNAVCTENECLSVLDGTIESGETFTFAVSTFMQHKDVFRYAYTVPAVLEEKIIFVEGRPIDEIVIDTRLIFFTVYDYGAQLAILLVIFLTISLHYTRRAMRTNIKVASLPLGDFLGSALLVLGTTLLIFIWQAAYNGNNAVSTGPRQLTITAALQQIQSGVRNILLGNSTTFYDGDRETLFGRGNYTYLDNIKERLEYICTNPKSLSMFYAPETYRFAQLTHINQECRLQKIPPSNQHLPTTWLDRSVRTGDNFQFILAKNTSRSTVEKMNWLLLTVYNTENSYHDSIFQQLTIHLRRAVPRVEITLTDTMSAPSVDGRPFSIIQIELPFIFYFIGITISFACLAIEVIYMPYIKKLLAIHYSQSSLIS
ncbi:hypothetical protein PMAYCL1PPCAC_22982 [Pristionchus mayeri]|uniref:Uncharacterized protein n=1 Tax=Pristionchus mayeri TaxID=1317129 RepID=A0AAN5CYC5_9BILA|nr:hypothetical protein PMAYCL1PPCAC_22982 [Pristionchus mayeri]